MPEHSELSHTATKERLRVLSEALRLSLAPHALLLALSGMLAAWLSWQIVGYLLLPDSANDSLAQFHAHVTSLHDEARIPRQIMGTFFSIPYGLDPADGMELMEDPVLPVDPVFGVPFRMVEPFRRAFEPGLDWGALSYYLVGGLGSLAVWGLFGGAISRSTVIQLGLQERIGLRKAFHFGCKKWASFFLAPALPLLGVASVAIPFACLGFVMRLDLGVLVASLVWLIVLLGCLLMTILGLGLAVSWPLMWGTISTESSDAFDAISRAYAYTFQRPLHYVGYVLAAAVLGTLGWLLAWWFSEVAISFSYWSISWGAGGTRLREIRDLVDHLPSSGEATPATLWCGAMLIRWISVLVRAIPSAYSFSFFWSNAAAMYLLLRADTDQTELDDIVYESDREFVDSPATIHAQDLGPEELFDNSETQLA